MKKNLQNAMARNFQNMVGATPSTEEVNEPKPIVEKAPAKPASKPAPTNTPVIETPVEAAPVAPQPQVVEQPAPTPVVEQPQQVQTASQVVAEPEPQEQIINTPVNIVEEPVVIAEEPVQEQPAPVKHTSKKAIPLVPDEKSSGVLHIRLGELRSYVDFMTQSGKISYQQYISNLIEQDYEKNKELYLKYKSFMDQLNF